MMMIGKVDGKYYGFDTKVNKVMDNRGRVFETGTENVMKCFETLYDAIKAANFQYEIMESGYYLWIPKANNYVEKIDFKKEYKVPVEVKNSVSGLAYLSKLLRK